MYKKKKVLTPLQIYKGVSEEPRQKKPKRQKSERDKLEALADDWYPKYIRLSEAEYDPENQIFRGLCFTCDRKLDVVWWNGKRWQWNRYAQDGHFVRRRKHAVKYEDTNNRLQCSWCNGFRDPHEMETEYARRLDAIHGEGYADRLRARGAKYYKPSLEELQSIIESSKGFVSYTLEHPEGVR